jgi:hypothetical protein
MKANQTAHCAQQKSCVVALRFYTSDTPEPVFDDVLKSAGVPLADKEAVLVEY